jgi:hypothetical protein
MMLVIALAVIGVAYATGGSEPNLVVNALAFLYCFAEMEKCGGGSDVPAAYGLRGGSQR